MDNFYKFATKKVRYFVTKQFYLKLYLKREKIKLLTFLKLYIF